jgi:phosphoserine phosphatase
MPEKIPEKVHPDKALSILEVARRLGISTELDELLDLIVNETTSVLNCERASLFLYDPDRHEFYTKIAHGLEMLRIPADRGIIGASASQRKIINVGDAYNDPRFNPEVDRKSGYHTSNILSCPLIDYDERLVGVLQAINKNNGVFTIEDEWLIETLGSQAAVALQRARLIEEYTEKKRIERELDLAREIQEGLLPKNPPRLRGYQVEGWQRSTEQTGGDCFDFIPLNSNLLGILFADASGHGIAPALVATQLRAMVRALISYTKIELSSIIGQVNEILCHDLPGGRFLTTFCGLLDTEQHELRYCSAGQGPILYIKNSEKSAKEFNAANVPLGIFPGYEFSLDQTIRFEKGDLMILVTDGFFEWENSKGEQFGFQRLSAVAQKLAHLDAVNIINGIRQAVIDFSEGTAQKDDLTAVVIKRVS